jgi:PAS domain S-box-containing protein
MTTRRTDELELLYRNAPIGLCLVDRELRFVHVNRLMALFDGLSEEEHVGRHMEEVIPLPARAQALAIARRVLTTGQPAVNEEVHTVSTRDPSREHWWLVSCHPVREDARGNGEVSALLTVLQNVTPIKRAEREAHRRLDELESVYQSSPVGLCFLDRELRYVRINEVLARIDGIPAADHLGRRLPDVIPNVAKQLVPLLERVLATGEAVRGLVVRTPAPSDPGREHVYLLTYEPVKGEDGTVLGIVGAVSDVTSIEEAEESARDRLAELEAIYRHCPVGLAHLDRELRLERVNDLFARMNGRSVEEHLGRRLEEVTPDLAEHVVPVCERVLATGEPIAGRELRGPDPAHPQREGAWIMSLHPSRSAEGAISGVTLVIQDITMLRRHQAEIEEVRARLAEAQRMAGIGSWEWDIVDGKVWWSPELYVLFGKDPRFFTPDYASFFELVHAADRPGVRAQIDATLANDAPYEVQFRVVRDDGSVRVLRCTARLERTDGGVATRLIGICLDVTAQLGKDAGPRR